MKLYLQLNEPGSGELTVPYDSARAADLTVGSYVELKYRGMVMGGFWIENRKYKTTGAAENADRMLTVTGRGALAILDDGILWDWMTPGAENTRVFWNSPDTVTCPNMHHKGQIMDRVLDEAINVWDNIYGGHMDRECYHDSLGNHILDWDFTSTQDSDGIAWDAAESESLEIRVGTTHLEMLRQFCALGQPTAGLEFNMEADYDAVTGITTLHIHQTPIGISLANTTVHFRVGLNCTEVGNEEVGGDIRNAVLVECSDPAVPFTTTDDPTSISTYRRREVLLQAANASTAATALVYADREMDRLKDLKQTISLKISDAVGPHAITDYNVGDWVYYDDGTGTEVPYRIIAMQLEWDDNWFADVIVELNSVLMETELRSARDLRIVGAQSSGSALMNPQNSQQVALNYWNGNVPSYDAAEGQVLMADGLGSASWEDIDGGSTLPGGAEHLRNLIHCDGANGSTTFTDELGGVWTPNGHAKLSTSIYKFATASAQFDGADDWISKSITASGVSNFTVETWVYFSVIPVFNTPFYDSKSSYAGSDGLTVGITPSAKIFVFLGKDTPIAHGYGHHINTVLGVVINTWYHIAVVRSGNVFSVFIDGVKDVNTTTQTPNLNNTTCMIGRGTDDTATYHLNGYMDEIARYDYAKYTVNFTPPSLPYTLNSQINRHTAILFRRGNVANLPSLFPGEPFIELDTGLFHVGSFSFANGSAAVANIGSTAETVGGAVSHGSAATASRSDHKHAITTPKIDDLATADDNTDLNANTTNHGLLLKAVAPAAGLSTVLAVENGETTWKTKALFDNTNPEASGVAAPGTSLIAARRDHVHPGGGAGHVIQDAGVDMTARTNLNFTGAGVTVTDDAGNDATVIDIAAGGGGGAAGTIQIDQSGGTGDTYGVLSGAINGINTTFTVSLGEYASGTLCVYLNGELLIQGTAEDWHEDDPTAGTFHMAVAPDVPDQITVYYGSIGSSTFVWSEVPTGSVDGVNDDFVLADTPVTGSLQVFRNGVLMKGGGEDYTLAGDTITFVTPPLVGSILLCHYQMVVSTSGNADTLDGIHASAFVQATLVTTIGDPGSDANVPSEQAVREEFDLIEGGWIAASGTWTPWSQAFTNDPAAGANIELNMADTSGFEVGDIVTVTSGAGSENARITVVHTNTHITVEALYLDHDTTSRSVRLAPTLFVERAFTNDPTAGANKELNMADTSGFAVGDLVEVSSSAGREYAHITVVHASTHLTVDNLTLDHTTTGPMVKQVVHNTFVIDTSVDLSSQITVGDKIKYTDGTVKYGIVVAISGTRITIYGGTDYTVSSTAAVTSPYFSHWKSPFGFPMALEKWTVRFTDINERSQATPVSATWYNLSAIYISIPKGSWLVSYKATVHAKDTATINVQLYTSLSTSNSTPTNHDFTVFSYLINILNGVVRMFMPHFAQSQLTLTARTAYYMLASSQQAGLDSFGLSNLESNASRLVITAICAYL